MGGIESVFLLEVSPRCYQIKSLSFYPDSNYKLPVRSKQHRDHQKGLQQCCGNVFSQKWLFQKEGFLNDQKYSHVSSKYKLLLKYFNSEVLIVFLSYSPLWGVEIV